MKECELVIVVERYELLFLRTPEEVKAVEFVWSLSDNRENNSSSKELIEIEVHDIRSFSSDRHKTVDDAPYGGGPGMILMLDPIVKAVESIKGDKSMPVILLSPQGEVYKQQKAETLSKYEEIILICGHYEGIDYRITELVVTDELSIGDFVLSGGEFAAMVLIDSLIRLLPGALGNVLGGLNDSHTTGFLQHPHYTRPEAYRGRKVPEILLSYPFFLLKKRYFIILLINIK